ncbi:flagellar motor switch protein FliN/FliY [Roseibium hamelinense]|uniref:Flagellar motor switch protein FliN n=1 Tax=Roseibium hamelinense TaxID=150831 RepID=A0A562SZG7_9HYPH|nr:flagellar motor switch protein FliN [Roseibium hamelinense]MTI43576.1 flagellar motor switch protein FliN [Roseibium hamelinense]TWI86090.1 flagellar motor switch protein FliN/FliY [Roseibium hamelinense]
MSDEQDTGIPLDELDAPEGFTEGSDEPHGAQSAADLEAVFDVPVRISAVLGHSKMHVSDLLKLASGTVLELDRKVGEAIDIYVNDRLVARGEVVLVEDKLGVTMTEIIKTDR